MFSQARGWWLDASAGEWCGGCLHGPPVDHRSLRRTAMPQGLRCSKVHGKLCLHNRGSHATCSYPLMISKEVICHPRGIRLEEVQAISAFRRLPDFHPDKVAIQGRHAMLVGDHPAQATTTKQGILVPLTPSSIHQALSSDKKIAWLRFNTQVEEHGQVTRRLHGYD